MCSVCLENETIKEGNPRKVTETMSSFNWWVAAIPKAEGEWWGYSSVPKKDCEWWYALPVYPTNYDRPVNLLLDIVLIFTDYEGKARSVPLCNIQCVRPVYGIGAQTSIDIGENHLFVNMNIKKAQKLVDDAHELLSKLRE